MPLPLIALLAGMGAVAGGGAAIGASRREGKERNPLLDSPDAETIDPDTDGAFSSFLEAIGRPGKMVNNALIGNWEGVGRQGVDLLGDVADAILPGDEIKHISRRMDKPEFSDVVGGMDPGLGKFAVDVLGGVATDPTTLIPGAAFARAGKAGGELLGGAVRAADSLVPGTADLAATAGAQLSKAGRGIRSVFGEQRVNPKLAGVIDPARSRAALETSAGLGAAETALKGLDDRQLSIIGDALDNFRWQGGKLTGELVPSSSDLLRGTQGGSLAERIAAHPDVKPEEVAKLADAAEQVASTGRVMRDRPGIFGAMGEGALDPITGKRAAVLQTPGALSDEYLGRIYEGLPAKDPLEEMAGVGGANAMKERKLQGWREVADFLSRPENAKVVYQRNALQRLAKRAEQQGTLAQRADIGQGILGLLRSGDLKLPDQAIVDEATKLGRNPNLSPDVYGIGNQSGRAVVGEAHAPVNLLGATEAPADVMGIGSFSGKSKPPSPLLGELATSEPMAGDIALSRGGKAVVGPSGAGSDVSGMLGGQRSLLEEASRLAGEQSGESVVGQSARQSPTKLADLHPSEVDAATKSILGKSFVYADEDSRALVKGAIGELAKTDPESARVAIDAFSGMAPRGAVSSLLAKANVPFKRAAVAGFLIPKLGTDVRNRLSGVWQVLSNPEARGQWAGMTTRFVRDMAGSISDALGMKMGADRFTGILSDWESALKQSGGSADRAIEILRQTQPKAADVIANGALDGYSRAEDLLKSIGNTTASKLRKASELPQRIMRGIEDRMRLGLALDLVDSGKSAADAARITGDTLYRYGSTSVGNRTARDIIPFFQFTAKAIPQQAKLLAEKPELATGLSRAMSSADDPDAPIYPYMAGKLNIPLGLDEQGNQQFISGMGLPFEALNSIPDASADLGTFGRSVERDTLGAAHPLLKTAFGAISGEDPYFESGFGSYGKVPLLGEAGAAGRAYNVAAGTGLLQPFDSPARLLGQVFDERRSPGTKAIDLLTGANVVNVDPDRALQQQLQDELERNPTVNSYRSFYQTDKDPETQALLHRFQDAKHRAKVKRDAEHAQAQAADVR